MENYRCKRYFDNSRLRRRTAILSHAKIDRYHAPDFLRIFIGNANASIGSSSRGSKRQRDEIIIKGLIKRNKEIKRRRYPWRDIHTHYIQRTADRGCHRRYHSGYLAFSRGYPARREPEVGAHSSFPVAWPSVCARMAD